MTCVTVGAFCAGLLLIAGTSSAFAESTSATTTAAGGQATQTAASSKANDPNKVICKTEHDTGSRLDAHRTCHTRAEWAEIEIETQRAVSASQEQGMQHSPTSATGM